YLMRGTTRRRAARSTSSAPAPSVRRSSSCRRACGTGCRTSAANRPSSSRSLTTLTRTTIPITGGSRSTIRRSPSGSDMLHDLFASWMQFVIDYGYLGVFVLMVLESTALPVPAEIVIPPAAFWASQGRMNLWLIVVAATAGSWVGSALSYWIAWKIGRPLVEKYG